MMRLTGVYEGVDTFESAIVEELRDADVDELFAADDVVSDLLPSGLALFVHYGYDTVGIFFHERVLDFSALNGPS